MKEKREWPWGVALCGVYICGWWWVRRETVSFCAALTAGLNFVVATILPSPNSWDNLMARLCFTLLVTDTLKMFAWMNPDRKCEIIETLGRTEVQIALAQLAVLPRGVHTRLTR